MGYNKEELLKLGIEEKIALAADLWDSIDESLLPVSEELQQVAAERYHAYQQNPDKTISFEELKSRLRENGF